MNGTCLTEEALVAALQSGQKEAFTIFYDAYSPALFGVILRLIKDQTIAQDLLQDTFIKIWTHRHSYDAGQGRLFAWLVSIGRNVALDELRRRKARIQPIAYGFEATSVYVNLAPTVGLPSGSVFSLVPAKNRQLMELAYGQQWTHEEIAQKLGMPLGTVKTRLRTALRELKRLFDQDIAHYQAR